MYTDRFKKNENEGSNDCYAYPKQNIEKRFEQYGRNYDSNHGKEKNLQNSLFSLTSSLC